MEGNTSDYVHHLLLRAYYGTDNCGQVCERWVNEAFPEDAFDPIEGTIELSEWPSSPTSSSSASLAALAALNISYPSFCQYNYADIFTWTPGASDYELPEDVGFRFGEATGGFSSVSVQTHYNNPEENVGVTDSSGVRIYYTEELRPMDMGTMELGDPLVELRGAPMHDGKSAISFECPGSCTEDNFEVGDWVGFGLGLGWVGLGWVGLGWVGLGWVGLGWVGLGYDVLCCTVLRYACVCVCASASLRFVAGTFDFVLFSYFFLLLLFGSFVCCRLAPPPPTDWHIYIVIMYIFFVLVLSCIFPPLPRAGCFFPLLSLSRLSFDRVGVAVYIRSCFIVQSFSPLSRAVFFLFFSFALCPSFS